MNASWGIYQYTLDFRPNEQKYRKAEYVQCCVCFVNVQLSLHEHVVFSVCALMDNAAYIIFIMWNSISGLEPWYHFRFNISCGVAVTVRSQQQKCYQVFKPEMELHMINIIYAALPMHAQRENTTFSCKDD